MTKEQIDEHLAPLFAEQGIGITLYVVLNSTNSKIVKKADIQSDSQPELKNMFLQSINEKIILNEGLSVIPLSSADERKNVIYKYDLEIPEELNVIDEIITNDNIDQFSFNENDISDIYALLIEIGNSESQIVLFKKIYSVNVFKRGQFFIKKASTRFEKIDDEFLRIDPNFEFIRIAESLFIVKIETLEKFFGFSEIIQREANKCLNEIIESDILDNPEVFQELITDISFARKLTKVAKDSPVLGKIPNSAIISFAEHFPALKGKIKFNEEKTKIRLHTKTSRNLFLKLLNDDYLQSALTQMYYDSLAKDKLEVSASETA